MMRVDVVIPPLPVPLRELEWCVLQHLVNMSIWCMSMWCVSLVYEYLVYEYLVCEYLVLWVSGV